MHASFLFHAIKAGMDMGIVNAGMIEVYEEIEPALLQKVEDVLFNRHENATEDFGCLCWDHKKGEVKYYKRMKAGGMQRWKSALCMRWWKVSPSI